jgi:hypothetical protein
MHEKMAIGDCDAFVVLLQTMMHLPKLVGRDRHGSEFVIHRQVQQLAIIFEKSLRRNLFGDRKMVQAGERFVDRRQCGRDRARLRQGCEVRKTYQRAEKPNETRGVEIGFLHHVRLRFGMNSGENLTAHVGGVMRSRQFDDKPEFQKRGGQWRQASRLSDPPFLPVQDRVPGVQKAHLRFHFHELAQ